MKQRSIALIALVIVFTLAAVLGSGLIKLDPLSASATEKETAETVASGKLPRMLDLGSKSCIPCKRMAPILDSLREEYKGRAEIEFIDTKENRKAAADHKITLIPTQIFFDTLGVEKFRHVGFYPADSIVTHLKALGVK
jgi:thioredoxin 1